MPDEQRAVRIGAVDDHPVILAGLSLALQQHLPGCTVEPVAQTVDAYLGQASGVDVILLDLELHDRSDPADNVTRLLAIAPVLLFTQDHRSGLVSRAFQAGASGILSKSEELSTVARAVRTVLTGEPFLSPNWAAILAQDEAWASPNLAPREMEAVRLYAAGMKLASVARRLGVSEDTARTHLLRARHKYAVAGRPAATKTDLYVRAVEDGLLPLPGSG